MSRNPKPEARNPDPPLAVVLDPANRVSLAVARSLGRAGVPVVVGVPDLRRHGIPSRGPVLASRHVVSRFGLPDPTDAASFARALERATPPGAVLLPVSINSLLAVLADGALRASRRVPFAPYETVRRANAKDRLLSDASRLKIRVPQTFLPADLDEALRFGESVPLPCVIKLRDDEGLFLPPARRYAVVRERAAYRAAYARLHAEKPLPIVQERIEGEGWGVSLLAWKGIRRASFVHRRIREYPREGGPGSLCESVHDDALAASAWRLLEGLEWEGPAMVEFRRDRATGKAWLLEVNPRFWGSLPLAVACGVDFPLLCYRLATGEEARAPDGYPAGVRLRFAGMELAGAWQDLRALRVRAAASAARGLLCDPAPFDGIFDPEDPGPVLEEIRRMLGLPRGAGATLRP